VVIDDVSRKSIRGAKLQFRLIHEKNAKIILRSQKKGVFESPNIAPGRYRLRITDESQRDMEMAARRPGSCHCGPDCGRVVGESYIGVIFGDPPEPGTYEKEGLSLTDHLLLEFDRERMMHKARSTRRPIQAVSGAGVSSYINKQTELGPLVAIATAHRSNSRLMVGTRIKHFLNGARQVVSERPDLLE
jgi:hypothetical protein